MPQCAVATCRNSHRRTRTEAVRYHRFPRPIEVRERWVIACGRIANNNAEPPFNISTARICSIHFEDDFYERDESCGEKRSRLKPGAVPTLQVPISVEPFQDMMRMNEEKRLAQAALKLSNQQKLRAAISWSQCEAVKNQDQHDGMDIDKTPNNATEVVNNGNGNNDTVNIANNINNCTNINLNINVADNAPKNNDTTINCSNTSKKVNKTKRCSKKKSILECRNADNQQSNEIGKPANENKRPSKKRKLKSTIEEPQDLNNEESNDILRRKSKISKKEDEKSDSESKLIKLPFLIDEPCTVKQADEREKTMEMLFATYDNISKAAFMRSLGLITHAEKEK